MVVGSMAVIDAARVAVPVPVSVRVPDGIVRASDSAKIPPPQPTSR